MASKLNTNIKAIKNESMSTYWNIEELKMKTKEEQFGGYYGIFSFFVFIFDSWIFQLKHAGLQRAISGNIFGERCD